MPAANTLAQSLFGASDRQLEGAAGRTGAEQPRAGRWEWASGKWPGQAGQSVPFSAACLSLDRHLSGMKKRSERPEALEKEQRLLQQAECQQQQQQQVGKKGQPGSQSSSKKSAVEGRPVSRKRVMLGLPPLCGSVLVRGSRERVLPRTEPLGACERCLVAEEVVPGWCLSDTRL